MTAAQAELDKAWIADGRNDIERWAALGLGIRLHAKQLEALEQLEKGEELFNFLWWANRVGKTTTVNTWHLHGIFYKFELPLPTDGGRSWDLWMAEDYRTLHTAPLGALATLAYDYIVELVKGTHPAQRDENGQRRDAPLAGLFTPMKQRDAHGADHMVVKSIQGGTIDYYSTEGTAGRLEGRAWRRISWDEWPQQEAADKGAGIRTVLTRLQNRAADYNAKVLLTGTITPEVEHIAVEWINRCEDPQDRDWWGSEAARTDNPYANRAAIERAERTLDPEDYARMVLGKPGGVRGRLLPSFMVAPIFENDLPNFTPPHPLDGASFGEDARVFRSRSVGSPWTYFHVWDLAIAAAANVGMVLRVPADMRFGWQDIAGGRVLKPIEGVKHVEIPGTRTLTSAEIIHTIEETYLPYGGRIVVDTTDAHGKNVYRELRKAGYPVDDFTFNERDQRRVLLKEAAIESTRKILTEGMVFRMDGAGKVLIQNDVPVYDPEIPYGVLKLPRSWQKARDQLSILRPDDDKQTKDEAMVVVMGCHVTYRTRRGRTRQVASQPFAVFGGGRRA